MTTQSEQDDNQVNPDELDDGWTEIETPTAAGNLHLYDMSVPRNPSIYRAPDLVNDMADALSTQITSSKPAATFLEEIRVQSLSDDATIKSLCPETSPREDANKTTTSTANTGGMDPQAKTRLLKACSEIVQAVTGSPFTNQSACDPLERHLQNLVRSAAFAIQVAAAKPSKLQNMNDENGEDKETAGSAEDMKLH